MKRVLRWVFISLGGVIALVVLVAGALWIVSGRKLSAKHDAPTEA